MTSTSPPSTATAPPASPPCSPPPGRSRRHRAARRRHVRQQPGPRRRARSHRPLLADAGLPGGDPARQSRPGAAQSVFVAAASTASRTSASSASRTTRQSASRSSTWKSGATRTATTRTWSRWAARGRAPPAGRSPWRTATTSRRRPGHPAAPVLAVQRRCDRARPRPTTGARPLGPRRACRLRHRAGLLLRLAGPGADGQPDPAPPRPAK